MKHKNDVKIGCVQLMVLRLILSLFCVGQCQTQMYISATVNTVQQTTSYKFLLQVYNQQIPIGSTIQINFPSEYDSIQPLANYSCYKTQWALNIAVPLACSIGLRTLTIENGFSEMLPNIADTSSFQWVVQAIKNPQYALITGNFIGKYKNINATTIASFSSLGTTISPGILDAQLSVNPKIVNAESTLTITLRPQHIIPTTAWVLLTSKQYWERAVRIISSASSIIQTSTSCINGLNTPNNLYCSIDNPSSNIFVKVYNIFSLSPVVSNSYSFTISNILNPPSTQPQGSFSLVVYYNVSGNSFKIDEISGMRITGSDPQPIVMPTLLVGDNKVGASSTLTIKARINSFLGAADTIEIGIPKQIGLNNLIVVNFEGTPSFLINYNSSSATNNLLTFKTNRQFTPGQDFTFILTNITNPSYVTTLSPFTLRTLRNNYVVDSVTTQPTFTYTTIPTSITCVLSTDSLEVGFEPTLYTFSITFETPMSSGIIKIRFPEKIQLSNSGIGCISSCSVSVVQNVLQIRNAIVVSNTKNLSLMIGNVKNGYKFGISDSYVIETYNSNNKLIGQSTSNISLNLVGRRLNLQNVTLNSTVLQVNAQTQFTLTIFNQNPIPTRSSIIISLPSEIIESNTPDCIPYCQALSNNLQISLTQTSVSSLSKITIKNIKNPTSTQPTNPINITINDQNNNSIEYFNNQLRYAATSLGICTMDITRNSTLNSAKFVQYNFTVRVGFIIGNTTSLYLGFNQMCVGCSIDSNDSMRNYYSFQNLSVSYNNGVSVIALSLNGLSNHYSLEPKKMTVKVWKNRNGYAHSYTQVFLANYLANTISIASTFSVLEFSSSSLFQVSSINYSYIYSYFTIQFPTEFLLNNTACNSLYSCSITYNYVTVNPINNTFSRFTLTNILTPSISPSNEIIIKTYDNNSYLIDTSTTVWSSLCNPPCKKCALTPFNGSSCISCYSNPLLPLVQGKVLLLNSSCVSVCGDRYYNNATTNTCMICSSQCLNCQQKIKCTSCGTNQFLLQINSTCHSICPVGYYGFNFTNSSINVCLLCDATLHCEICTNYLTCQSCLAPYFYYQTRCIQKCPNVTLGNQYIRACVSCPQGCSFCQQNTNYSSFWCTKCISPYVLDNGGCYTTCRTFGTISDGEKCIPCQTKCLTCFQSSFKCLTCNNTSIYKYFLNNNCLQSCPNGYYPNESSMTCSPCISPCQYCLATLPSSCTRCLTNFTLHGSVCNSNCPIYLFEDDNKTCLNCVSPCLTCISSSICMTCVEGSFIRQSTGPCISDCGIRYTGINGRCIPCSSNCKTCKLVNFCTSCQDNQFLLNGTCMKICSYGYFPNNFSMECAICNYSCQSCLNASFCVTCQLGYKLSSLNQCDSTCMSSQVPIGGICQPCSQNCTECQITTSNCTKCKPNFFYSISSFSCDEKCAPNLNTFELNLSCLLQCPTKYYSVLVLNISKCERCGNFCLQCTSSNKCSSCEPGTYTSDGICYQKCPSSAPFPLNSTCRSCNVVDCFQCNGSSCLSCNSGLLLIGDSLCLSGCGNGNIYNFTLKKCIQSAFSNGTSQILTPTISNEIKFVPVPYLLTALIATLVCFVFYCGFGNSIIALLLGVFSALLAFASLTPVLITLINGGELNIGLVCLITLVGLSYVLNIMVVAIEWHYDAYPEGDENKIYIWVINGSSLILSYKLLSILCSRSKSDENQIMNCIQIWKTSKFQQKFLIFCKIFWILDLGYIVGGIILVLRYKSNQFPFFSGIEIVILAVFDSVITFMWVVGIRGQLQKKQIYRPSDSFEKLEGVSSQDDPRISQNDKESINRSQPVKLNDLKQSRAYKSVYTKVKDTIKLSGDNIEQAIEKGVFRRNQQSLFKQQQVVDEMSELQSAGKMNLRKKYKEQEGKNQTLLKKEQQINQPIDIRQNDIIFQMMDQNIETDPSFYEEDDRDNVTNKSLGSLVKPILVTPKDQQSDNRQLIIQDYEEKHLESNQNHQKTINIFQTERSYQNRRAVNIKKQQKYKPNQLETRQNFNRNIIHADLQSIGTAQQDYQQFEQEKQQYKTINEDRNPTPFLFEMTEDLTKPSELFSKTKKQRESKITSNKNKKKSTL